MEFVRFTQPVMLSLIPRELFEVDDDLISPQKLAECLLQIIAQKTTFFFAILDDNRVVGFYWAGLNLFSNRLQVYILSIDKDHQTTNGENMDMFKKLSTEIVKANGYSPIIELYSNHPKVAERYGLTKARCTIMEFDTNKESEVHDG